MRGGRPFEGAKNEKTPDSNLMICRARVGDRAIFMWNIAGTLAVCQVREKWPLTDPFGRVSGEPFVWH